MNNEMQYVPMSKEQVKDVERTRGAVVINGGHLEQSPFRCLDPKQYPLS